MTEVRISSDPAPAMPLDVAVKLAGLFTRSAAMGVLTGPSVTRLDSDSVRRLVRSLHHHGIAKEAGVMLAPLLAGRAEQLDDEAAERLGERIDQMTEALEASAAPVAEWPAMREVFGDGTLAELLEVSLSSLKRYASGQRATPDPVAERLHWLAMVVADLAGAYNDFGIRRWFARPRAQLGGASPREYLGRSWQPESERSRRVRQLASALSGGQPLAV